ncbi:MAG: dTDP-4-dehydrorhamnose 3,5-epimerase family protein, partial [Dehalobacterium sp.]
KESNSYAKWTSVLLSSDNKRQLFMPAGFAHGFLTLEDNVQIQYKVNEFFSIEHDSGFLWNDPSVNIDWGIDDPILSEKDRKANLLIDCEL